MSIFSYKRRLTTKLASHFTLTNKLVTMVYKERKSVLRYSQVYLSVTKHVHS